MIAFPGRNGPQKHARILARHGYGVLLFDRRGEGESEGDRNMFGWGGDKDILAAIAFLKTRPDVDPARIAGMGLSVGAELMLETAAGRGELAAVVSEGAGTRWPGRGAGGVPRPRQVARPAHRRQDGAVAVFSNTAPPPKLTDPCRASTSRCS